MAKETVAFEYQVFENSNELSEDDKALLETARNAAENAYAPYSHFFVGAVAKLQNGETVTGTNQENASYPVGICAERVLLGAAAILYPNVPIQTIALSYDNHNGGHSDTPISPCGMCRQALREYEERTSHPIRLILGGKTGKIFIIENVGHLLPFSFGGSNLKGE
jgi:cytidine deaminase